MPVIVEDSHKEDFQNNIVSSLVGQLHTTKTYSKDAFRTMIGFAWQLQGDIQIVGLEANLLFFRFTKGQDRERSLLERPWVFNNSLLQLFEIYGSFIPREFAIRKAAFGSNCRTYR